MKKGIYMNSSPVSIAVIDSKKITKAEILDAARSGKTVKIKAIENGKYLLAQGNDGAAPENISVKRVGKNLLVFLEGSKEAQPDLIIEDYFTKKGEIVGKAEDGTTHPFIATDGVAESEAAELEDGEFTSLALSEEQVADISEVSWLDNLDWSPALIALGGLAAIAAAAGLGYVAGKHAADDNASGTQGNGNGNGNGNGDGKGGGDGDGDGKGGGGDVGKTHKPFIDNVNDDIGSIKGEIANGSRTDDTKPTLNGRGTPGNVIEIWDGSTKVGETTINSKGQWSYTPSTPLKAGEHTLSSRERDSAGKVGQSSDPWKFIIDLTAPAKGVIGEVLDDTETPPKAIDKNGMLKDTTPTITGQAEANSIVMIWDQGNLLGSVKADSAGKWSFTTPVLAEGKHDIYVVVQDEVGNTSVQSEHYIIEVDTTPPVNKGIGGLTDDDGTPIVSGSSTEDATPTFSGEGDSGDIVYIVDNGKIIGSAKVEEGKWTFTPENDLAPGKHEFEVVVKDPAGNSASSPEKVIVDIVSGNGSEFPEPNPNVPVTGRILWAINDDNDDFTIRYEKSGAGCTDPKPTFEGIGNPGDTAILYVTGPNGFKLQLSAKIDDEGSWFIETPELPDGDYQFEAAFYDGSVVTAKTAIFELNIDTDNPKTPGTLEENLNGFDIEFLLAAADENYFSSLDNESPTGEINEVLNKLSDADIHSLDSKFKAAGAHSMVDINQPNDDLLLNQIEQH